MNKYPHYYGHRKRLKERFPLSEFKGMPDYKLLELLLTYAISRKDVKPIVKLYYLTEEEIKIVEGD